MLTSLKWVAAFLIYAAAAGTAFADMAYLFKYAGDFAPAGGGAVSCIVLEVDGTSKLLLEDGSGCIQLES